MWIHVIINILFNIFVIVLYDVMTGTNIIPNNACVCVCVNDLVCSGME